MRTFTRFPSSTKPVTPEKQVQNGVVSELRFHGWMVQRNQQGLGKLKEQDMTVLVVDDSEKFLTQLEEIQERLWPGKGIRRLC